jgi:hypothetical protein
MTEVEVNKERMALGIAALRSGEFPQAAETLCKQEDDGTFAFCCLGVLTEVAIANGLEGVERIEGEDGDGWGYLCTEPDGETIFEQNDTPNLVQRWYGLGQSNPTIKDTNTGNTTQAIEANDDYGWDFNEIADGFEAEYLGASDAGAA